MAVCRPVPGAKEVPLNGKIKRFPEKDRQLLKTTLQSHGWQSLAKDFRIKTYTDVRREHLTDIVDDVDGTCPDLKEDVKTRLELVKRMQCTGEVHVYKGGSEEGSKRVFYRYYMFVRANTTRTYDLFLASLCRKEEEPSFFGLLWNAIGFVLFPQHMLCQIIQDQLVAQILSRCIVIADEEDISVTSKALMTVALSRSVVPKGLGDRIIEFEFVEDLIDKGFLIPGEDGSQMTLKFG